MNTPSPKSNLIRGAIWTVGTRWVVKALGFVNTVIMARLLVPEDYGIVAMGMLMVGFIQTFLDFSATIALLRKKEITKEEIDSAWTLRLLQSVLAGLVIAITSPIAVRYFGEPRLFPVLLTFALCVMLAGGSNVAQTLALREYNFSLDFKITALGKLTSVLATVLFGFFLRDYRALTLGIVFGYISPLILSYIFHPYRPRWDISKIPEIWHLTKWLLLSNIGGFLMSKCDELIAGRLASTAEFGAYNVGSDFGQLPVAEIGPALQRATLPVLASIKGDYERTRQAVLKTLSAVSTIVWPIAFGFAAVALDATRLVLGERWLTIVPFVEVFSIVAALQSSLGPLRSFLTLRGQTQVQSTITWVQLLFFIVAALILTPEFHLLGLAYARIVSALANWIFLLTAASRYCELTWKSTLTHAYRPIILSILMYSVVSKITCAIETEVIRLPVGIVSGILFYITFLWTTWHLSGRPEGLESTVIDRWETRRNNL